MSASNEKMRRRMERENGVDKRTERQREADEKARKEKLHWRLGMAALSLFVILSIVLNTSLPYHLNAEKIGDTNYSAAEMNYFYYNTYSQYYQYIEMFGADPNQPLESQDCPLTEEGSWKDFFMETTMESVKSMEAIYAEAMAEGYELSEEGKAKVEEEMEHLPEHAEEQGFKNVNRFLRAAYGMGVNKALVKELMTKAALVEEYAEQKHGSFTPANNEEVEEYFNNNLDSFREYNAHCYLVAAETEEVVNEEDIMTYEVVEGGIEAAMVAAKEIAAKVTDEASFEAAVAEYAEGARISHIHDSVKEQLDAAYRDWVADPARVAGDVETFETDKGAYVVLYEGYDDNMYSTTAMRHILIKAVDTDEDGAYSEAEVGAAKLKIDKIESEWLASDMTEETFAEMANKYSEDEGSNTNGGLYENIGMGEMVPEIDAFLYEDGRNVGDTAVLHGNNGGYDGYHLVYFAGEGELYGMVQAKTQMMNEAYAEWEAGLVENIAVEDCWAKKLIGK